MAVDYGTKSIGIAITDELQLTVRPLATIRREKRNYNKALDSICSLAAEHDVGTMVVGLPLNMDGTHGEAAGRVEKFVADLQSRLSIPILTIDERLTSYEADQILRGMGIGEKERRAKSDEYAALIILRDYLDGQSRRNYLEE